MNNILSILKALSVALMAYQLYRYNQTKKVDDLVWAVLFATMIH